MTVFCFHKKKCQYSYVPIIESNPDWNIKNTFMTVGGRRTLKSET